MKLILDSLQELSKFFFYTALLMMIFEGIYIFPLKWEFSFYILGAIGLFLVLGIFLGGTTSWHPMIGFLVILLCNLLGFGGYLLLQNEEFHFWKNIEDLVLTYVPIIVITFVGYLIPRYYHRKKEGR